MAPGPLSLISYWYIASNCETAALAALEQLAKDVRAAEPDTLSYLIHIPFRGEGNSIQSLPPSVSCAVLFFEIYRTPQAFLDHVNGPIFVNFVEQHGSLFVNANGKPFTTVEFLSRVAGFSRAESGRDADAR
jgi:hypothetical protein